MFSPLPRLVPPWTCPPSIPLWRWWWSKFCSWLFPPEVALCCSLLFSLFTTIFTAKLRSRCCFTGRAYLWPLFDLQSSCVDLFAQLQWLVVESVFTKLFTHHHVQWSISALLCPCSGISCLYCASLSQQSTQPSKWMFAPDWLSWWVTPLRTHLQKCFLIVAYGSAVVHEMTHVDFLFGFVQRYEAVWGHLLLKNLFQWSFGHFSLVRQQMFTTSAEYCAYSDVFWCTKCVERRFRYFLFLFFISAVIKISPAVSLHWFSWPCDLRFLLDVLRSRLLLFVGDASFLFCLYIHLSFIFNVDDLGEKLGRNCRVT